MTQDDARRAAEEFCKLAEKATPGHMTVDCITSEDGRGNFTTYEVKDESGKTILDALNSDAAVVHTEIDEDSSFTWDETANCNLHFVQWCFNHRAEIAAALKHLATPAAQPAPAEGREALHKIVALSSSRLIGATDSERVDYYRSKLIEAGDIARDAIVFANSEQAAHVGTAQGVDWVLVPREPTEQMMDAGQRYINSVAFKGEHNLPPQFRWTDFWEAILSAQSPASAKRWQEQAK